MKIVVTARDFSKLDMTAAKNMIQAGHTVSEVEDALKLSRRELYEAVKDADGIIAGTEIFDRELLKKLTKLKIISRRGIGVDSIDLEAAKEFGITITRTLGLVEGAVAEHVMAYIFYFARQIHKQTESMKAGEWNRLLISGAKSRTLGLVGFGGIGKEIAKRAVPFGMNVLYYQRHPIAMDGDRLGASYVSLDELLAKSDYVSVNIPLNPATKDFFTIELFRKMKPSAVFINIARGAIVKTEDLVYALKHHMIAAAAVDVYEKEPCADSPLLTCETAVLTPHTAAYTSENFIVMNEQAAKAVIDFFRS